MKKKLLAVIICLFLLCAMLPMQAMAVEICEVFAVTDLTLPVEGATPDFTANIVQTHYCKVVSVQWMDLWTDNFMDADDRFVKETDTDGNQHTYRVLITIELLEGNIVHKHPQPISG